MSVAVQHNPTLPTLSPIQAQVVAALAKGATASSAARQAGINRSTVYEWKNSLPDFAAALQQARAEFVESLRDELKELSSLALQTLRSVLEDPKTPPSARVKAALAVLERPNSPDRGWSLPAPLQKCKEYSLFEKIVGMEAELSQLADRAGMPGAIDASVAAGIAAVARNSLCPCGSGLKYKRCCGRAAPPQLRA